MYDCDIVVDLEFTPAARKACASYPRNEVIEIGAVRLGCQHEIADTFECRVKPEYATDVAPFVTRLTGIHTEDLTKAPTFGEALLEFSAWIGDCHARMVCWDMVDRDQIRGEASAKEVAVPKNMRRWFDLQKVYPRVMNADTREGRMALRTAAAWYGIDVDDRKAHRVLYDAQVTAQLMQSLLTGAYREQLRALGTTRIMSRRAPATARLDDLCGGKLDHLKLLLASEGEAA